jgi:hypothetical protein
MNVMNAQSTGRHDRGLDRIIEPLASYICAADRPTAVLNRVVAALLHEVQQTNRVARAHIAGRPPAHILN